MNDVQAVRSDTQFTPAYHHLHSSGELARRVERAYLGLSECRQCPRECGVNRLAGHVGECRIAALARVSSFQAHYGEESPLTGWRGSGTIFFAGCNLHCQFCQNYDISQSPVGMPVEPEQIADMMIRLQDMGCHNVNLVSPSHVVAQILAGLVLATQAGLRIPLVYNTGGYDSIETLELLDGVIDIYMPDMKYSDNELGNLYSLVPGYPAVNQRAVREMHRQVGDLQLDDRGIATRGLLVRHLVLPHDQAGTERIAQFLASKVSADTYINLMDQYRPCFHANEYEGLRRPISLREMERAQNEVRRAGLWRLDQRARVRRTPLV